jgi:hypothetical protein
LLFTFGFAPQEHMHKPQVSPVATAVNRARQT